MAEAEAAEKRGIKLYKEGTNLERFLELNKPTSLRHTYNWVYVKNPSYVSKEEDHYDPGDVLVAMLELFSGKRGEITAETIKDIARETKCTYGKWMIFRDPRKVDEIWSQIARATVANKLGPESKAATAFGNQEWDERESDHVICVYTRNFLDEEDVMNVERALRDLGITGRLSYKPDIYTHLNIYKDRGNCHLHIKPTLYMTY